MVFAATSSREACWLLQFVVVAVVVELFFWRGFLLRIERHLDPLRRHYVLGWGQVLRDDGCTLLDVLFRWVFIIVQMQSSLNLVS